MNPDRWLAGVAGAALCLLLMCTAALGSCAPLIGQLPPACLSPAPETADAGQPPPDCTPPTGRWDHEQVANAAIIAQVGTDLDVPVWGQVIAVTVAMHESRLRNVHGGHGRLGLFQQQPSHGWGSRAQLLDPAHAARAFYHKLLEIDGWQQLPAGEAAQAVQQHSSDSEAYTAWVDAAAALVAIVNPHPGGWVPPVTAPIVSGFRTTHRPDHLGVDLGAPRHQIVIAASTGTVTTATCQARHTNGGYYGCDRDGHPHDVLGCGWYVTITHPGGHTTRYCHLHTRPWVQTGQQVVAGQPIGQVGSTGQSSGPHLHYETWTTTDTGAQVPVNPTVFMRQRGAPLQPDQP